MHRKFLVRSTARALSLPLLALVACGSPAESLESSGDDLVLGVKVVSAVHATATGSSVTVTYARSVTSSPLTITLAGPTSTTTLAESTVGGATGAVFAGLDECTAFTFTLTSGASPQGTGHVHTMRADGSKCTTTETLFAKRVEPFRGMYHWRNDASYCTRSDWSNAYRVYPTSVWWTDSIMGPFNSPVDVQVGYTHYWDPGSQPFPCAEEWVDVHRVMLEWEVDPSRKRRVASAKVQATVASGPLCVTDFAQTMRAVYNVTRAEVNAVSDSGMTWSHLIGPNAQYGIERMGSLAPLVVAGNQISADVTTYAKGGGFYGGFVANDGYPSLNQATQVFPTDNASCNTTLSNVEMAMTYSSMPAITPLNCAVSVTCNKYTVTCDGSPQYFTLHEKTEYGTQAVDFQNGSFGAPLVFNGTLGNSNGTGIIFSVCATELAPDGTGPQECTGTLPVTVNTCTTPPSGGGGGGGGGGRCGGHVCPQ